MDRVREKTDYRCGFSELEIPERFKGLETDTDLALLLESGIIVSGITFYFTE